MSSFLDYTGLTRLLDKLKAKFAAKADLATVATTGSYNDLSNKPTIPADSSLVHKTGAETIQGVKTFEDFLKVKAIASNIPSSATYKNLCYYPYIDNGFYRRDGAVTGAIRIILPQALNGTFLSFIIYVQDDTAGVYEYHIKGYMRRNDHWGYCQAYSTGTNNTKGNLTVRFGFDSGKTHGIISIGETTTTWTSVLCAIYNVTTSYGDYAPEKWATGWQIETAAALPDIVEVNIANPNLLTAYVPTSRTINGKALSGNVTLAASDVGALASNGTAVNASSLGGVAAGSYAKTADLAAVALSGDYEDLSNTPAIPDVSNVTITLETADGSTDAASVDLTQDFTLQVPDHTHSAANVAGLARVASTGSYNDLADKPTIPGGVTVDAALSSTSVNPVQNKAVYSALAGKASSTHSHTYSSLTSRPTTLAGYGITDAKISGGVITLGGGTITPITSHQSLSGYATSANVSSIASGIVTSGGYVTSSAAQSIASAVVTSGGYTISGGVTISSGATISGGISYRGTIQGDGNFVFEQEAGAVIKNTDSGTMYICGGSGAANEHGACLRLDGASFSPDPGSPISSGGFYLKAADGTSAAYLKGMPDGELTWTGSANIQGGMVVSGGLTVTGAISGTATSAEDASSLGGVAASGYVKASGGSINGTVTVSATEALKRNVDNNYLRIMGGTTTSNGAYIDLHGENHTNYAGRFRIYAKKTGLSATQHSLVGTPDGNLTWDGNAIQTSSDERLKTDFDAVPQDVLEAWEAVQWQQFRYIAAKEAKGEAARLHTGLVAQRVKDIFDGRGLDACSYGILCHEEWQDEWMEDENGSRILVRKAGEMWTIRYEEALAMEAACQRRKTRDAQLRIEGLILTVDALERRLNEMEAAMVGRNASE